MLPRMDRTYLFPMMLVAALAACDSPRDATPASDGASASSPAAAPASTPPPAADPALPRPEGVTPDAGAVTRPTRFDGYGPVRFGMTEAEVLDAWDGKLRNDVPGEACHYLQPDDDKPTAHFALMIEDGRFVRYDVGNPDMVAPGGGKVGLTADEIRALYPGRVEARPHKYVEGGHYLRVPASEGSGWLVFETDATGKVTSWRAGVAPQVDYIEGCA